jgi:hypothetical protein
MSELVLGKNLKVVKYYFDADGNACRRESVYLKDGLVADLEVTPSGNYMSVSRGKDILWEKSENKEADIELTDSSLQNNGTGVEDTFNIVAGWNGQDLK